MFTTVVYHLLFACVLGNRRFYSSFSPKCFEWFKGVSYMKVTWATKTTTTNNTELSKGFTEKEVHAAGWIYCPYCPIQIISVLFIWRQITITVTSRSVLYIAR